MTLDADATEIEMVEPRITRREEKKLRPSKRETREQTCYVIVFTTVEESEMSAAEVLAHYRFWCKLNSY